jgi:hypothetical protein
MRFRHYGRVVLLGVCLALVSTRANAATITLADLSPGVIGFSGTFDTDNDVALVTFTVSTTSPITATSTGHLGPTSGFDPIFTLFGPGTDFLGSFDFLGDWDSDAGTPLTATLDPGTYLLAITQYNNYYSPSDHRFDYDNAPGGLFTRAVFGPDSTCEAFVDFEGGCRSNAFAGTISGESVAPTTVPEPGTMGLLSLGGAALLARGRHRRARSGFPPDPSLTN